MPSQSVSPPFLTEVNNNGLVPSLQVGDASVASPGGLNHQQVLALLRSRLMLEPVLAELMIAGRQRNPESHSQQQTQSLLYPSPPISSDSDFHHHQQNGSTFLPPPRPHMPVMPVMPVSKKPFLGQYPLFSLLGNKNEDLPQLGTSLHNFQLWPLGLVQDVSSRQLVTKLTDPLEAALFRTGNVEGGDAVDKAPQLESVVGGKRAKLEPSSMFPDVSSQLADLRQRIDAIQSVADCKLAFHYIADHFLSHPTAPASVLSPAYLSHVSPTTTTKQLQRFDITRVRSSNMVVSVLQDGVEEGGLEMHYSLSSLFEQFWTSKSHLTTKSVPSAFTRFVLSRVLGTEISKYTYCKLNSGKRGYRPLSNQFVQSLTDFLSDGLGIDIDDTQARLAMRVAVENVVINTCGNARKKVQSERSRLSHSEQACSPHPPPQLLASMSAPMMGIEVGGADGGVGMVGMSCHSSGSQPTTSAGEG